MADGFSLSSVSSPLAAASLRQEAAAAASAAAHTAPGVRPLAAFPQQQQPSSAPTLHPGFGRPPPLQGPVLHPGFGVAQQQQQRNAASPLTAMPPSVLFAQQHLPQPPPPPHVVATYAAAGGGNLARARVAKRITIAHRGSAQDFRVPNRLESAALLRDAVATAFALPPPAAFSLRDVEGCNVVLSFASVDDDGLYTLVASGDGDGAAGGGGGGFAAAASPGGRNNEASFVTMTRRVASFPPLPEVVATGFAMSARRKGSVRAVLVGVQYSDRGAAYALTRAKVVGAGVRRVRAALEASFEAPEIVELTEEEAEGGLVLKRGGTGRSDILKWAAWLAEGTKPAQHRLFYFMGHAAVRTGGGADEAVLLPSDFRTTPDDYNAIGGAELLAALKGESGSSGGVSVVLDTSYASAFLPLPARLRLYRCGETDMVENRTDQDSPLLGSDARRAVSVLACGSARSGGGGGATVEGVLTDAFCSVLERARTGSATAAAAASLSVEQAMVEVAVHMRQRHPLAGVAPVLSSTVALDLAAEFVL